MLHEPASQSGKDPAAAYKSKLGIWMFLLYALFYVGFVVINLTNPMMMEMDVVAGLNLATIYGFALIIVALIQALIYDRLCRVMELKLAEKDRKDEAN